MIDGWGPPGLVRAADAEWPRADWPHWHRYRDETADKFGTKDADRLTPAAKHLIARMSEIDLQDHGFDVDAFPDLNLHGAGLHCIPPGGFLGTHLDGERHPLLGWRREVNGLLFTSPWRNEWAGRLVFGDGRAVSPEFNRLVLFQTHGEAYHGVERVTGPMERRTISLFWWSLSPVESTRERAEFVPPRTD